MGPGEGMVRQRASLLIALAAAERAEGNKWKGKVIQRKASSLLRSRSDESHK